MDIAKKLSCDGVPPSGPVSAWPQERHFALMEEYAKSVPSPVPHSPIPSHATKVSAGIGKMAKGLVIAGAQAVKNGKVTEEIYNERLETCRNCPLFVEDSKRCSDCGCFMQAKAWIGGDPDSLCPQKKWSR